MVFFRIIKKTIKFIFYQMPKKWLIMIIFAMAMTFGLTQVKGFSFTDNTHIIQNYDASNLTFYEGIMLKQPLVTDIQFNDQQGYDLSVRYVALPLYSIPLACGTNNYGTGIWDTKPDLTYIINENTSGDKYSDTYIKEYVRAARVPFDGHATNPCDFIMNYRVRVVRGSTASNLYYSYNASFQNTDSYTDYSSRYEYNTTNSAPLVFALCNGNNSFYIRSMLFQDESHALYPVAIGESGGLYDTITGTLYYLYGSSNFTTYNSISNPGNPYFTNPYITTSSSNIVNYSFNSLSINGGSLKNSTSYGQNYFTLVTNYMGISVNTDIDNYKTVDSNGNVTFSVPKSELIDNPSIATGRSVNWQLLYYKSVEGGRDIITYDLGTYTFDLSGNTTEENNTIEQDQTLSAISNLNNSINETNQSINNMNNNITNVVTQQEETNNFLQDTNVNTSGKTIPSPTIQNSEVVSQIDSTYQDFFSDYLYIFASDLPVTISLYIPNMSTGGIASTINIPSNYVKAHLTSVSIPFTNYSLLELIYMVWYVLFAFWFLGFATNLVTILFSGEIMDDKGLRKLTNTYTGVSKNML